MKNKRSSQQHCEDRCITLSTEKVKVKAHIYDVTGLESGGAKSKPRTFHHFLSALFPKLGSCNLCHWVEKSFIIVTWQEVCVHHMCVMCVCMCMCECICFSSVSVYVSMCMCVCLCICVVYVHVSVRPSVCVLCACLCAHVCLCVCFCTYECNYAYMCVSVCKHRCQCACMCTCVCLCVYLCILCVCVYACVSVCVCVYVQAYMCVYLHVYVCTHVCLVNVCMHNAHTRLCVSMWLCVHICVCVYLRVCVCVRGLPKLWVVGNSAQPWLMMTLREYGPKCSNFSGEAKHLYLYTFDISMSVPLKRKRNQNLVKVEHPGHCCQASAFNLYPCLPPSQSLESLTTFLCLFQPWTHLV